MTGTLPDRRSRPDRRRQARRAQPMEASQTPAGDAPVAGAPYPDAKFAAQVIGQMLDQMPGWKEPRWRR